MNAVNEGDRGAADEGGDAVAGPRQAGVDPRRLAEHMRFRFILAYWRHHRRQTGLSSDFGCVPMPRWDGGTGRNGRVLRPIWPDIARLVIEEDVGPDDLVEAAFGNLDAGGLPLPTSLLSPHIVARAKERRGLVIWDVAQEFVLQCAIFQGGVACHVGGGLDVDYAVRLTLMEIHNDLSLLFCFLAANAAGESTMAERFEEAAFDQYLHRRYAYDLAWASRIPDSFKARADRILPLDRGATSIGPRELAPARPAEGGAP